MASFEERFWSRVTVAGDCWEWNGYRDRLGYGHVSKDGVGKVAHRVAYELLVGPILAGLTLDHLCRNRACVNPDHLEPVTQRENWMRGSNIARTRRAKTHCPHGHPYSGDNLYVNPRGHRMCRICQRASKRRRRERAVA